MVKNSTYLYVFRTAVGSSLLLLFIPTVFALNIEKLQRKEIVIKNTTSEPQSLTITTNTYDGINENILTIKAQQCITIDYEDDVITSINAPKAHIHYVMDKDYPLLCTITNHQKPDFPIAVP